VISSGAGETPATTGMRNHFAPRGDYNEQCAS
jgi:hypothetical protein